MAPTIDDLLNFLKQDKEERALECEKYKSDLKTLISEGVKNEIANFLEPIKGRVDQVEKAQEGLSSQLKF